LATPFGLSPPVDYIVFLVGAAVPIYIAFGLVGLSGFRELTRYQAHNSFYYALNPATKILALFLVAFSMSSASLWLGLAATSIILISYATLDNGARKFALGLLFTIAVVWGSGSRGSVPPRKQRQGSEALKARRQPTQSFSRTATE